LLRSFVVGDDKVLIFLQIVLCLRGLFFKELYRKDAYPIFVCTVFTWFATSR
jgi:hypothetical protein